MARRSNSDQFYFEGFESPNTTPVPDVVFDHLLARLGEAELKALLYIIRRTFGFKRDRDPISFNQFLRGITTRDGRVLDEGSGVRNRTTLSTALKSLEQKGIVISEKGTDERGENVTTVYRLRFKDAKVVRIDQDEEEKRVVRRTYHPSTNSTPPVVRHPYPQQTDIQQTDFDPSKFERSHDQMDATKEEQETARQASLKELITRRRQRTGGPRRGGSTGHNDDRERLRPYLEDFARELGDEAPLSSTITRTLTIFTTAGVPPERWSDLLYQARGLTQEHTASIRKQAGNGGGGMRRKNKMPYFLATLEQLVGLRPAPSRPPRGSPPAS